MDFFQYRGDTLHAETCRSTAWRPEFGTPTYVYSRATLERHWHAFDKAFADRPHLVCYAVKANGNLGVLNALARLESGFDIVSLGELERVLAAGGEARRVVFSGVGKRADEMRRALELGIRCFNVDRRPSWTGSTGSPARSAGPRRCRCASTRTSTPRRTLHRHRPQGEQVRHRRRRRPRVYRRAADLPNLEVVGIDCTSARSSRRSRRSWMRSTACSR